MEILKNFNTMLGDFDNIIGALGLIISIVGIIVGFIGGKEIHTANKLKTKIRDIETKVEKIEVSNSQVAQTINNNGIGLKDTDYLINKVVDEKTKNKPDIFYGTEKPEKLKDGDIYIQI